MSIYLEQMRLTVETLLEGEQLNIADVGSTGGPEQRWKVWKKLCFFYTFDPDPRATAWQAFSQNFPIGLWSYRCQQPLYMAAYPPATSLYKPNCEFLRSFSAQELLAEVGKHTIQLDTLDRVLVGKSVDFLKIDAEGAEIEILKGGSDVLSQCLGLQLETLFCPIRRNAPLFPDINAYVRQFDFQLFHLEREHWVRKNGITTYDSAPQLIWGNVLYLLSKESFLQKIKTAPEPDKLFARYILILLAYRLYDYAYEICEEVASPACQTLQALLKKLPRSPQRLLPIVFFLLLGMGKYFFSFSTRTKQHRRSYVLRKLRELGSTCLYLSRNDFAIYD